MKRTQSGESLLITLAVLAIIGIIGILAFGIPAYGRYQTREYAENEVHVNNIRIQQTEQLIKVEEQKAKIRVAEAKGIAESQSLINASLTPLYLQHEAIKAQERMANSQNHTQIYIPVGNNGIPIVYDAAKVK